MKIKRKNKARTTVSDLENGQMFMYMGGTNFFMKIEEVTTKNGKIVNAICLNDNRLVSLAGDEKYDVEIIKGYFQEED